MIDKLKSFATIAILIVVAILIFKDWHILTPKEYQEYVNVLNAEPTVKVDTIVQHDTITLPGKTIPVPIYTDTTIIEHITIDTAKLNEYVKSYFALHMYADTLQNDIARIAIIDSITQNTIIDRQWSVSVFKTDTIYREVQTTVVKNIVHDAPKNNIDFHYAISDAGVGALDLYWLSYTRQFGSSKLQFRVGADVGYTKFDNTKGVLFGAHAGIAF